MKHTRFRSSHGREVQQLQWRVVQPKTEISAETSSSSFMESIQKLEAAQAQGRTLEEALAVQKDQIGRQREVDEVEVLLWSCDAGGQVLESNAEAADQSSREIKLDCSTCAWDEQRHLIAVGRTKGSVEVLKWQGSTEAESTVVYRFHEHMEAVTCVSWSKGEDAGLLASGSKDGTIFVYRCGSFATEQQASTGTASPDGEGVVVGGLVGHSGKVTALQWCPETVEELLLASSSVDGTVQVWNAKSQQRVAHFGHHVGRVLSLNWVSPFVLVTGGEDQTLRLWDYRAQRAESALPSPPLAKQIKSPKMKKPQQMEPITSSSGEYAGNAADNNLSDVKSMERQSTDSSDLKKPSKSKSKKKKALLFHPEVKLTSEQIAVACYEAVEAPSGSLPVHSRRAALREYFTAEEEQFRGEQDWESVANVLLLQGKIGEALRVVAKEGALTPTWLAYAPMAGLDVWRDMTNVYAHQLDAQGDKKAAALHFLSISKIRSAVGCLVSGDAYKEALALIQVRLSPHDPLLHETLWKYAEFLVRHSRQREAALEFLRIGSIQAESRAIHALISVGDMRSVETALDVLLAVAGSAQKTSSEKEEEVLSFPASFFFSIAGRALATSSFSVAEKAGQLLQSRVVSASAASPPASYRLTRCLLGVMKAVDEHRLCHGNPGEAAGDLTVDRVTQLLQSDAPESVREFFTFLTKTRKEERANEEIERVYRRVCCLASTRDASDLEGGVLSERALLDRSDRFWAQVLTVCRASGYWFDSEGETHVEEAQDLLVEGNCFVEITKAVAAATSGEERGTTTSILLQVAQRLLRLVVDVMSVSFVSALECMRESFELIVRVDDSDRNDSRCSQCSVGSEDPQKRHVGDVRVDVMTLLFPIGFVSLSELPRCGELAEEQPDTLLLCSSVLLSQCTVVLLASLELEEGSSAEQKAQLLRSLLRVLRREFLQQEEAQPLSQGLMDAGNQQQVQLLLNEVLVAAYQLPDGSALSVVSNGEGEARGGEDQSDQDKDCKARRGGLISEVNAVRESLTWSPDAATP
ncbi:hypothetical protein BBJ28_00019336 [Nothophytophthora sp. Chile5]|nr:hypothetical protein BBJ28_00019336 [Nothophytophthora sp. Chile5]